MPGTFAREVKGQDEYYITLEGAALQVFEFLYSYIPLTRGFSIDRGVDGG